jgi:hypothetical protein
MQHDEEGRERSGDAALLPSRKAPISVGAERDPAESAVGVERAVGEIEHGQRERRASLQELGECPLTRHLAAAHLCPRDSDDEPAADLGDQLVPVLENRDLLVLERGQVVGEHPAHERDWLALKAAWRHRRDASAT